MLRYDTGTVAIKIKCNENVSKMVQFFDDVFIGPFKILDAPPGLVNLLQVSQHRQTLRKTVSEYDQKIPQSHTADQPMAPRGRTTER